MLFAADWTGDGHAQVHCTCCALRVCSYMHTHARATCLHCSPPPSVSVGAGVSFCLMLATLCSLYTPEEGLETLRLSSRGEGGAPAHAASHPGSGHSSS